VFPLALSIVPLYSIARFFVPLMSTETSYFSKQYEDSSQGSKIKSHQENYGNAPDSIKSIHSEDFPTISPEAISGPFAHLYASVRRTVQN
jgi:hypothetical protein